MAHITAGVEYGLHCLLYLVGDTGEARTASARDLADLQGVPVDYVAKLFTKLQKAGVVAASEGARGGFRLARPAEAISVLDVVMAIDGEKPLFDCREIRGRCAIYEGKSWTPRGVCAIHAVMLEAEARMREILATQSLAGIAAAVVAKAAPGFGEEIAQWLAERAASPRRARDAGGTGS